MEFPRVLRVRQHFPDHSIKDIPAEVSKELTAADLASKVPPGGTVAIGVGSRGIVNLAAIVRAAADYWNRAGRKPFIFPAMGSHGAATAEGQADVLAHYGITAESMGCPIRSGLEVSPTGQSEDGIETYVDRLALESDGIMMVARVKWHTDFVGEIESGLFKMMAIGLGKFAGAQRYHTHAYKMGLERMILSVGRQVLKSGKVLGGLAILEDANHRTGLIEGVPAERMEEREKELLALAKSWMGHIPVSAVDILIVDEIGKNISGAGMDTKVVNRTGLAEYNPWPNTPVIERILVRDLSPLSYGNGLGVGMADVITNRLLDKINWEPTIINCLTASILPPIRVPIHYETDRECLEKLAPTVGKFDLSEVTSCRIRNSMQVDRAILTENLLPEIESNPALEVVGEPLEMEFDESGNLTELLAPDQDW
jgi:hypothetical protein